MKISEIPLVPENIIEYIISVGLSILSHSMNSYIDFFLLMKFANLYHIYVELIISESWVFSDWTEFYNCITTN